MKDELAFQTPQALIVGSPFHPAMRISAVAVMTGKLESEPIIIPTSGLPIRNRQKEEILRQ